jgi:ATP-dependent helicase Lhr and Lhr-like helicase
VARADGTAEDRGRDESVLAGFHPAVSAWFTHRFPEGPTPAQEAGWPAIAADHDTLIAAPTGSGKTLAAFLVAIDRCLQRTPGERKTSVLYVSPLRALTVDVAANLIGPLGEIRALAESRGETLPEVTVAVRNGDTPPAQRAQMLRQHPDIVVTTPESLYLLASSRKGRALLAGVEAVIVDEIHALARDKRGSHLALSLERLDAIVTAAGGHRPVRIGCSATQRPIERVARLLVGAGPDRSNPDGSPDCAVVDVGHRRELQCDIVLPTEELGAVMTIDQLDETVASIAEVTEHHRTTLVFVNTRRMAERIAHLLEQHLEEGSVSAHHGSLSMERRLGIESRLRAGELRCVVATASLELGIDVGPIDLVCQIGSPRAISTFLQRIGRSEHRRDGIPKGRLYPLTRDELTECVALLGAVRDGVLDAVHPPVAPLDILAQQLVAEVAARGEDGVAESELRSLVRAAAPYAEVTDHELESVLALVSDGVATGRGRRGAHLHRDEINGVVRPRRGASLTALTSGGAIPELADYRVLAAPDDAVVGSVHEDFAVEAMAGDVFLLGTHSWRIQRIEPGTVRVVDAAGAAPTLPFWLGEAPGRTDELSEACSRLRHIVSDGLERGGPHAAVEAVRAWSGVDADAAEVTVAYLAAAHTELGGLPTREEIVFERFFDDTGGMQLVVHSPFGARVNRGLGLALRKRFCRSFDFELQAAANDDAIVLSLGPQHAFALEEVPRYLAPQTVRDVLIQAMLPTPIFAARWRWNLGRSLVSPRFRGARHLPPAIQRMEADDLMAAIFPMLAACQENVSGPIEVPDHPIVNQTVDDCLFEAMDIEALTSLVAGVRDGTIAARCVDTAEPSLLAHEILNGRPYTFLDDAPLEERRTRSVSLRRGIPIEAHDLTSLDPGCVTEVTAQVRADPRDPEELHDLLSTVYLLEPDPALEGYFATLEASGRALLAELGATIRWCATERRRALGIAYPSARFIPDPPLPERLTAQPLPEADTVIAEAVRGHLEFLGPTRPEELAVLLVTTESAIELGLVTAERAGAVLRVGDGAWCARRIAQRIRFLQTARDRQAITPATARDLMRFLLEWQHVTPQTRRVGTDGLLRVITQLEGYEIAVGALERGVLGARVRGYQPTMLDELCTSGQVSWGRIGLLGTEASEPDRRSGTAPSRQTPIALMAREDQALLLRAARGDTTPAWPVHGAAREILEALERDGALFFSELCDATGRFALEVADGLWDALRRGLVTADGFAAVRSLLAGRYRNASTPAQGPAGRLRARAARVRQSAPLAGGRWSLLGRSASSSTDPDDVAEAAAAVLLDRYGVVFRELVGRDPVAQSWSAIRYALRRLEARGLVRGGRFVTGFSGEQFALPEAVSALRAMANRPLDGTIVELSAADPLNLTGVLLPGPRVASSARQTILLSDGVLAADAAVEGLAAYRSDARS